MLVYRVNLNVFNWFLFGDVNKIQLGPDNYWNCFLTDTTLEEQVKKDTDIIPVASGSKWEEVVVKQLTVQEQIDDIKKDTQRKNNNQHLLLV